MFHVPLSSFFFHFDEVESKTRIQDPQQPDRLLDRKVVAGSIIIGDVSLLMESQI